MYEQVDRPKESKSRVVVNSIVQKKSNEKQGFGVVDNRQDKFININNFESGSIIQYKVLNRGKSRWYSTFDPFKEFSTQKQAMAHDLIEKKRLGAMETDIRVPTAYTYTHSGKSADNVLGKKQGPHTAAHKILVMTFSKASDADLKTLFDGYVKTPQEVNNIIDIDENRPDFSTPKMKPFLDRLKKDYKTIYDSADILLQQNPINSVKIRDQLNRLLNLDPYATYKWWTRDDALKSDLKGKSEANATTFDQLHDSRGKKKFKNQQKYNEKMSEMKAMYDTFK